MGFRVTCRDQACGLRGLGAEGWTLAAVAAAAAAAAVAAAAAAAVASAPIMTTVIACLCRNGSTSCATMQNGGGCRKQGRDSGFLVWMHVRRHMRWHPCRDTYIYICTCIHMYVCMHACMYVLYVCTQAYLACHPQEQKHEYRMSYGVYTYAFMNVGMQACTYVCMYVRMDVCMHVCFVCMYSMYVRTHVLCTCVNMCVCAIVCMCIYVRVCRCAAHVHIYMCICTFVHTSTYVPLRMFV